MPPAVMKVLIILIGLSTAYAQHIKTIERNFTLTEVPFDITKYNGTNSCGSIVSDRVGGICITWEAIAATNSETSNNFGEWIVAGTKINGSRNSISINGAPAGLVPDMYYTYTGEIGGVLSNRRVKTTINIDRMDCLNPECTWIGDRRYVVDTCEKPEFLNIDGLTATFDESQTCQSPQWVFNKIRGTNIAVGRQLALDSNITNNYKQDKKLKYVDVQRNVKVQSLVGDSSILVETHYVRYYKDENRTVNINSTDIKNEDPKASIKDSTMHAILSKLYVGYPSLAIRALEINDECKLFLVNGNNCNITNPRGSPAPMYDDCDYDNSAPVESMLVSRYYFEKIITGELYELYTKGLLTEKTLNATVDSLFVSNYDQGYNTSLIYRLGAVLFTMNNTVLAQMENASELVDLAVEYPFACFQSGNISTNTCAVFNGLSSALGNPFEILEYDNDMWLKINMSGLFNFVPGYSVQSINWDGMFDYMNRQTFCVDFVTRSFDGLNEVDRWHNAMETLVYITRPNSLIGAATEVQPGIKGDSCTNSENSNSRQDTQYLADLVVQVTNNALQTVSPTLTSSSAVISFILAILSFVALVLTIESRKFHNIAVLVTALALLATVGILVGDNVNAINQNRLFLNSALIVEKVPNGNCNTLSPLYISAITQSYVANDAANVILWTAFGVISVGIILTLLHIIVRHRRTKMVP